MVSALLGKLTWATPGQTPLERKSGFPSTDFFVQDSCSLRTSHLAWAAMQPGACQCSRVVSAMPTFGMIAQLPKILITVFFDHSFSHHFSHVISVERYLRWWKVCRERDFFWSEWRIQLENQAGFGEGLLHAAMQCGTGVAAEWPVGYQRFQNSSISFCHSRGSNRRYHLSLQIWSCILDGFVWQSLGSGELQRWLLWEAARSFPYVWWRQCQLVLRQMCLWPKLSPSAKAGSASGITYLIATETQVLLLQGRKTAMEKGLVNH